MTRYIYCAAVKDNTNRIWHLVPPARHHNILHAMHDAGITVENYGEQGFLDSELMFVGRRDAFLIATEAGQVTRRRPGPENYQGPQLFSEDMW